MSRPGLVLLSWFAASLVASGARAAAPGDGARVLFAVHGNPFMAAYDGHGFVPLGNDVGAVLRAWAPVLRARRTFPGLDAHGRRVPVEVRGLAKLTGDLGERAFATESPALFWSAPGLEVRALELREVPVRGLDPALPDREVIGRAQRWRTLRGTAGEGNPNPPEILDPALPGNLRLSALEPRAGSDLVLIRVELFARGDDGVRRVFEGPLLLLYSRSAHAVLGSVGLAAPELHAFEIAGDPAVYLLYDAGGYECDGTTILPVERIRGADLSPSAGAATVWCS